jgi:hypothetical protein
MRYKLPPDVGSVSVEGRSFAADENGVIDVQEISDAGQAELVNVIGAVPIDPEQELAAKAEEDERGALYDRLAQLGVPADRRRRYPVPILQQLIEDAEAAAAPSPAAQAPAPAAKAPRSKSKQA